MVRWLVTLMNTVTGLAGILGGHNAILVEGIQEDKLFVRQCDIGARAENKSSGTMGVPIRDVHGVISKIRIFETYYDNRNDYNGLLKRSWPVARTQAEAMLQSIAQDKDKTDAAERGEGSYLPYRFSGRYKITLFSSDEKGGGDNCASWCIEKLKIAHINIPLAPLNKYSCSIETR